MRSLTLYAAATDEGLRRMMLEDVPIGTTDVRGYATCPLDGSLATEVDLLRFQLSQLALGRSVQHPLDVSAAMLCSRPTCRTLLGWVA